MHKFDWNSGSITYIDSYRDLQRLIMTLAMPTIDYFIPILAKVDFPEYLIKHPDIWKSVFADFAPQYKQAINNLNEWSENDFYPAYNQARAIHHRTNPTADETRDFVNRFSQKHKLSDFHTYLKMWKIFLEILRDRTDKSVATEVERWIYRHYLSTKYWRGAHEWWCAIVDYQEHPELYSSAPDFFLALTDEIYQEINYNDLHIFNEIWQPLYYEKYYPEYEQGGIHSPYLADPDSFTNAFQNIRVSKVLQFLAQSLTKEEIMLFIEWTAKVSYQIIPSDFNRYSRDLVLADIPFTDFPSILNISDLKQSITFSEAENTHLLLLK
jgi:hypothetical protein